MKKNYHQTKPVEFESTNGIKLSGRLETPILCEAKAYAIFAHCFTCSKDIAAATHISRSLAALGIAVLRFDFAGLGKSEGSFADSNFSSNVEDLVKAAEFLSKNYAAPQLLIGHSLGGAAVLAAAGKIETIEAVATIGAPAEPAHVAAHFAKSRDEIVQDGEAKLSIGGRDFCIKKQFLEDIESQKLVEKIAALKKPILVMHSPTDSTVGIENAQKIYEAASHPKSFVSLAGADHILSNKKDSEYVAETISSWAKRYLNIETNSQANEDSSGLTVSEVGTANFVHRISANGHSFIGDEPKSIGGADAGAAPYDFLLASLGLCKSVTLRLYAEHKGWDLQHIEVELEHSRKDEAEAIAVKLNLKGELSEEQINRLHEIAEKCPVQRTLQNPIEVETKISVSD